MADEPEEAEKLNEYDRTEQEVAECDLAEELADKIQAVLKDQPHNATMDALGMVLRSMADEYYGSTYRKLKDIADDISDLQYGV